MQQCYSFSLWTLFSFLEHFPPSILPLRLEFILCFWTYSSYYSPSHHSALASFSPLFFRALTELYCFNQSFLLKTFASKFFQIFYIFNIIQRIILCHLFLPIKNLNSLFIFCFFNKFIYLFIFGCVGSLLLHVGFLYLRRVGTTLRCGARASHCSGFFYCGARALGTWTSVFVACRLSSCGSWALELRLSSCRAQAQLLLGMWDLPRPGVEPMSLEFAGRFLTIAPPGKSPLSILTVLCLPISHDKIANGEAKSITA